MRCIKLFWSKEEEDDGKAKRMRANDGGVDPQGRFGRAHYVTQIPLHSSLEVSSHLIIVEDLRRLGLAKADVLFRLDPDGQLHRVLSNFNIPNGMSFLAVAGRSTRRTHTTDASRPRVTVLILEDCLLSVSSFRSSTKALGQTVTYKMQTGTSGLLSGELGRLFAFLDRVK
jgi:hypothetical protein